MQTLTSKQTTHTSASGCISGTNWLPTWQFDPLNFGATQQGVCDERLEWAGGGSISTAAPGEQEAGTERKRDAANATKFNAARSIRGTSLWGTVRLAKISRARAEISRARAKISRARAEKSVVRFQDTSCAEGWFEEGSISTVVLN